MILSVVNLKGGVGKSTLSVHAAAWLHAQGLRVAAVDADRQRTLSEWLTRAAPQLALHQTASAAELLRLLPALGAALDAVVVDGPAALAAEAAAMVSVSDVVLLPVGASPLELSASYRTARMIYKGRFARGGAPKVWVVLNRVQARTRLARIAATAILRYGFPVAPVAIAARAAFADAAARGLVVSQLGSAGRDAASELDSLFRAILPECCREQRPMSTEAQRAEHPAARLGAPLPEPLA